MKTHLEAPVTEPLSLENVTRRYGRVTALAGIELELRADEVLAVVGPSGCGKSTLLELVAGLQEPDDGTATVGGESGARERKRASPETQARSPEGDGARRDGDLSPAARDRGHLHGAGRRDRGVRRARHDRPGDGALGSSGKPGGLAGEPAEIAPDGVVHPVLTL